RCPMKMRSFVACDKHVEFLLRDALRR
ncbi:hypothetical protein PA598K_07300, partial [Paenibacillus sp. 598K]